MADDTATKPHKPRKARSPKPEATSEGLAERRERTEWTRAKLDMLQAVIHDPRMNAKQVRLFAYVLQCTNYLKRVAIVHDQMIMDEVPGFGDEETIRRNRKHLRELGWWDFTPGRGIRSTIYTARSQNIEGVMSRVREVAKARKESHAYRKEALRSGRETLEQQHQTTNEMRGKRIKRSPQNAGEMPYENEGISLALTPAGSGKGATGRSQDVELRPDALAPAEMSWCPDCGTMLEADGGPRCVECESDAKARCVIDFPRSEAGEFMCIDCGTETRIAAAHSAEDPFCPFCPTCIETNEFTHQNQIDPAMRPIEVMWPASWTTPETNTPIDQQPANDPGAEYRRARDGG